MKSLDEVIEAMVRCGSESSSCSDDNRTDKASAFVDALEYLKMFRSERIRYEAERKTWAEERGVWLKAFENALAGLGSAYKEMNAGTLNKQLAWDELFSCSLIGTPLWWNEKKEWLLVTDSALDNRSWVQMIDAYGKSIILEPHDIRAYSLYRTRPQSDK